MELNPESEVALPGDSFEVVDEFDVRTEETMKGHQYMTVRPGDIVEYIGPATRQGSMYRPFFRFKVHLPNKQTYIFSAPRGFIDSFVEKMEE
jgi:hypothetical protein